MTNICITFSTEPESARHLVVGGDVGNKNLWMSDGEGKVWRQSVKLPYGDGKTSYGASLVNKEDKVRFKLMNAHIHIYQDYDSTKKIQLYGRFT